MRYCQTSEDTIIDQLLSDCQIASTTAVEFGAGDGYNLSNIRHLQDRFDLIQFDIRPAQGVIQAQITAENINQVFTANEVPWQPAVLSIDIDGNDYWVWQALQFRPSIVCIEFNGCLEPLTETIMPYDPGHIHNGKDDYYGASWLALKQLGESKGYTYITQTNNLNMFFVRHDYHLTTWPNHLPKKTPYHAHSERWEQVKPKEQK